MKIYFLKVKYSLLIFFETTKKNNKNNDNNNQKKIIRIMIIIIMIIITNILVFTFVPNLNATFFTDCLLYTLEFLSGINIDHEW